MTVAPATCLDHASLKSLLERGGATDEIDRLAAHLETCARCGETVESLLASDLTAAALRGNKIAVDEPSVQLLRARLTKLRPAAASLETTTGANSQSAVSPPSIEATKDKSVSLAPPQQPDEIGRLSGYRLLAELGRGGMGVVYKAEDLKLKRLVALKVMAPSLAADAAARQRFLREAVAMAAVHHDNIVVIHTVDEDNAVPFLAMEFLQGMPLDKWLKGGRKATPAQVLKIGREIAEGLAAAHERGLIHRDIKPGNIWLDSAHKGRVKILDFGLARSGTEDVHLTQSGAIVGTPAYMSPEQARGEKVDGRCDLFSLGCVLYRLCTGVMPFRGDTTMALLMSLGLDHPKTVRELKADVPEALSDLVMRLLEKEPAKRPQSARDVVQAIQAISRASAGRPLAEGRTEGMSSAVVMEPVKTSMAALPETVTDPPPPAPACGGKTRRPRILTVAAAGFVAAAIAAAIVIIVRDKNGNKVAEINLPPDSTVTITNDEKKDDAVGAAKPTVDEAWIKQVAALPADKQVEAVAAKLKQLNPGFDGDQVTHKVEEGKVTDLTTAANKLTDISPLRALPGLRRLACTGVGETAKLSDLSPLKGMKLTYLDCAGTSVSDLSALEGMSLRYLYLNFTPVRDLSPLRGMPLTELRFYGTPVSDLSPLKGAPLILLECAVTNVADLGPLKGAPLVNLQCFGTQVADLSPLRGMPLQYLHFSSTRVSDLAPLTGMALIELSCEGTKVADLSPLEHMKLDSLLVDYSAVSDLSPLKGMPLKTLACAGAKVVDLSLLKEMPLKELRCDFDPKRDAAILRSVKSLETINGKPAAEFWKDVDGKKP